MRRWRNEEFVLLVSQALLVELVGKLEERGIGQDQIQELLVAINRLAEWVDVPPEAVVPVVVADSDDDQILACAIVGGAHYLVTYDPHFDLLEGMYQCFDRLNTRASRSPRRYPSCEKCGAISRLRRRHHKRNNEKDAAYDRL
jgi:hypothetical protein